MNVEPEKSERAWSSSIKSTDPDSDPDPDSDKIRCRVKSGGNNCLHAVSPHRLLRRDSRQLSGGTWYTVRQYGTAGPS